MTNFHDISSQLSIKDKCGPEDAEFISMSFDSRNVEQGSLFVAVKGTQTDGHQYITTAVDKGASIIVCESLPETLKAAVLYVVVENGAEALGLLASSYYGHPSQNVALVGVTGTNGKTTTATLLYDLFTSLGYKCGLLSTVENRICGKIDPSTHTTPDPVALNVLLQKMVQAGCNYVFMEVSSHAIHQRRIAGLQFAGGIFTNLTHDHLDYHKTFMEYLQAKKRFFDDLSTSAFALINVDDKNGEVMVQNTKAKIYRYSLRKLVDFKAKIIENSLTGLHLDLDGHDFYGRMIGEFNAYNLLAVYGAAVLLGAGKEEVLSKLSNLKGAEGRFDYLFNRETNTIGIVDYAHTPDALEKVLQTIAKLRTGQEHVITVVGCGGDRDKTKRPIMAKTACQLSNQVILTSDNPRTEDPEVILHEMEAGIPANAKNKVLTITNRLQAIKTACTMAKNGDIILVAGKGHEKYQDINGVKHPFDDKQTLETFLF